MSSPLQKVGRDEAVTIIRYRISQELAFRLCTHNSSISQWEAIHWGLCMAMNISYWGKAYRYWHLRPDQSIQRQTGENGASITKFNKPRGHVCIQYKTAMLKNHSLSHNHQISGQVLSRQWVLYSTKINSKCLYLLDSGASGTMTAHHSYWRISGYIFGWYLQSQASWKI